MSRRRWRQSGGTLSCLTLSIRIWGVFTAIVICGVGVDVLMHGHTSGLYILLGSALVFFLEVKWIITLFVELAFNHDPSAPCSTYWSKTAVLGGWRLAPPYIAMGLLLILFTNHLWLSTVAGCQLIVLAALRILTICRYGRGKGTESLLPQTDEGYENSRCDDSEGSFRAGNELLHEDEDESLGVM